MRIKLLNYFSIILISLIGIVNFVAAPPPLDVELRAEKQDAEETSQDHILKSDAIRNIEVKNSESQIVSEQIKKNFDSMKINLKEGFPESVKIIEDPKKIKVLLENKKVDKGEVVEEFTRLELPTDFNEYDVNNDGYIDLEELIDTTGARENAKSAFDDSDVDGDGQISKKEFSYWFPDGITIDISDELNNYNNTETDDEVDDDDEIDEVDNDDEDDDDDDDDRGKEDSDEESDEDIDDENTSNNEDIDVEDDEEENNTDDDDDDHHHHLNVGEKIDVHGENFNENL